MLSSASPNTAVIRNAHTSPSPFKRPRRNTADTPPKSAVDEIDVPHTHTVAELYRWTFTPAAVAPCFIKDVLIMKENKELGLDFFWLGRVPCRIVQIVALVIAVQQYESNTRYTNDGTGVIDCMYRHAQPPTTPKRTKPVSKRANEPSVEIHPLPPPLADVGMSVRIRARVTPFRDTRCLRADNGDLTVCASPNEEPLHWIAVVDLHSTSYGLPGPFTIPPAPPTPPPDTSMLTSTSKVASTPIPETPSTVGTASPTASALASSPARAPVDHASPPRLRHPSRLHSRDLTDITFRIYLKHYMDNAHPYRPPRRRAQGRTHVSSPATSTSDGSADEGPATPTLSSTRSRADYARLSPTPRRGAQPSAITTLRTPLARTSSAIPHTALDADGRAPEHGFTLGYLRRVPELADMARRVVVAERKRREREARRAERAQAQAGRKGRSDASGSESGPGQAGSRAAETTARKIKRLFVKTIRDLYTEGTIVLWDGPVRVWCPADAVVGTEGVSRLWKLGADASASLASMSTATASSVSADGGESGGELSDEDTCAEAYVPVTTQRVATLVEGAITALARRAPLHRVQQKPPHAAPLRVRPARPTVPDILAYVRGADERWANLGQWAIEDALEALRRDERVYKAGSGRWALCL